MWPTPFVVWAYNKKGKEKMGLSPFMSAPKAPRAINGPDQEPVNGYIDQLKGN